MAGLTVPIDEVVHFDVITGGSTGQVVDADSAPTWEVFEEDNDTPMGTPPSGTFTKRTDKTGNYKGSFTASAANGFEVGKFYNVIASGTVSSVTGKCVVLTFRCVPAEASAGIPKVDVARAVGVDQTAVLIPGTVDTGSFVATINEFEADDITEATENHYVGRVIVFTSGALTGQACTITDYALSGANGHFTVSTLTEAPANNDTFLIY
jgi:hypothetical protein